MLRIVLGAIAGVMSAFVTVWLIQLVGHTVFPPPAGLDPGDMEAFKAYVESLPIGALLFVLFAYVFAAFDGVLVACLIARASHKLLAGIVGGLMLAATLANVVMIPHPAWFIVAAAVGIPSAAAGAALLGARLFGEGVNSRG